MSSMAARKRWVSWKRISKFKSHWTPVIQVNSLTAALFHWSTDLLQHNTKQYCIVSHLHQSDEDVCYHGYEKENSKYARWTRHLRRCWLQKQYQTVCHTLIPKHHCYFWTWSNKTNLKQTNLSDCFSLYLFCKHNTYPSRENHSLLLLAFYIFGRLRPVLLERHW